jgi:hypothetical protein
LCNNAFCSRDHRLKFDGGANHLAEGVHPSTGLGWVLFGGSQTKMTRVPGGELTVTDDPEHFKPDASHRLTDQCLMRGALNVVENYASDPEVGVE